MSFEGRLARISHASSEMLHSLGHRRPDSPTTIVEKRANWHARRINTTFSLSHNNPFRIDPFASELLKLFIEEECAVRLGEKPSLDSKIDDPHLDEFPSLISDLETVYDEKLKCLDPNDQHTNYNGYLKGIANVLADDYFNNGTGKRFVPSEAFRIANAYRNALKDDNFIPLSPPKNNQSIRPLLKPRFILTALAVLTLGGTAYKVASDQNNGQNSVTNSTSSKQDIPKPVRLEQVYSPSLPIPRIFRYVQDQQSSTIQQEKSPFTLSSSDLVQIAQRLINEPIQEEDSQDSFRDIMRRKGLDVEISKPLSLIQYETAGSKDLPMFQYPSSDAPLNMAFPADSIVPYIAVATLRNIQTGALEASFRLGYMPFITTIPLERLPENGQSLITNLPSNAVVANGAINFIQPFYIEQGK